MGQNKTCTLFKDLDFAADSVGACSKESCCYVHIVDLDEDEEGEVMVGVEQDDESTSTDDDDGSLLLELSGWQKDALNAHNAKRDLHKDTPRLTWSTEMAKSAQEWADKGQFKHSDCYNIPPP